MWHVRPLYASSLRITGVFLEINRSSASFFNCAVLHVESGVDAVSFFITQAFSATLSVIEFLGATGLDISIFTESTVYLAKPLTLFELLHDTNVALTKPNKIAEVKNYLFIMSVYFSLTQIVVTPTIQTTAFAMFANIATTFKSYPT